MMWIIDDIDEDVRRKKKIEGRSIEELSKG